MDLVLIVTIVGTAAAVAGVMQNWAIIRRQDAEQRPIHEFSFGYPEEDRVSVSAQLVAEPPPEVTSRAPWASAAISVNLNSTKTP